MKVVVSTSVEQDHADLIDTLAEEHRVNRAIYLRWLVEDHIQKILPTRPVNKPETQSTSQAA